MMKKNIKILFFLFLSQCSILMASSQDMTGLVKKIKAKLDLVNDYTAEGKMKTDVAFIKAPIGKVKVFFKKPNLFKLKREHGFSILPKGGISVNMSSVIDVKDFMALSAGETVLDGVKVKIVKLLPMNENSDVVLTTLYIDVPNLLIKKATTTTRENGTYEIQLAYGRYSSYGLPDKVIFSFNTKAYKMPKGITLEFEDDKRPSAADRLKQKKGRIEISYSSYIINKGILNSVFRS